MNKILFSILFLSVGISCFPLLVLGATPAAMEVDVYMTFKIPARMALSVANSANTDLNWFLQDYGAMVQVVKNDAGTITVDAANPTIVIGNGTSFTTDFKAGDFISTINAKDTNGNFVYAETHVIKSITNNTHLITEDAWTNAINGSAYSGPEYVVNHFDYETTLGYFDYSATDSKYTTSVVIPYDGTQTYSVYVEFSSKPMEENLPGCTASCSPVTAGSGWFLLGNYDYYGPYPPNSQYTDISCSSINCPCFTNAFVGAYNDCSKIAVNPANIVDEESFTLPFSGFTHNAFWRSFVDTF